jgi:hypothetical protein
MITGVTQPLAERLPVSTQSVRAKALFRISKYFLREARFDKSLGGEQPE